MTFEDKLYKFLKNNSKVMDGDGDDGYYIQTKNNEVLHVCIIRDSVGLDEFKEQELENE